MALIVEDGSGKPDAESYASLMDAASWHTALNQTRWFSASVAAREAALRLATIEIDGRYRWPGRIANVVQALGWPRTGTIDSEGRAIASDVVPKQVIDATCQAALKVLGKQAEPVADGPAVASERWPDYAVTYDLDRARDDWADIDRMLESIAASGSSRKVARSFRLVRAS